MDMSPETLGNDPFPRIPEDLKEYDNWVNWTYRGDTKVPVNSKTLGNASVAHPNTWSTYEDAVYEGGRRNLGVGFVLTEDDPFTCIDLDKCFRKGQPLDEQTRAILDLMSGYVELSPSLRGLHIWLRTEIPVNRRTNGLEVYSSSRYITMTGRANPNTLTHIPDRTEELQELLRRYFPQRETTTEFYTPEETLEDTQIWQRLFNSRNGHIFEALYRGDTSVTYNDHSRGVIFLANMLAMMTEGDPARMKHLLYQTGLRNEKWERRLGDTTWIDYQIWDAIRYTQGRK